MPRIANGGLSMGSSDVGSSDDRAVTWARRDVLRHAAGFSSALAAAPAHAQGRARTLLSVSEGGPNALDCQVTGANRSVYEATWNLYDRLISFGTRTDDAGNLLYDPARPVGEAAEDIKTTERTLTFRLRKDAHFHDGAPLTAADVKWSFERSFAAGGVPKSQMLAASITRPEQFVVVDDRTIRLDMDKPDKLAMICMGIPTVILFHAAAVKAHATEQDPWGFEWTRNNTAGGGAYRVERFTPGSEIILARNPAWRSGAMPKIDRVIWRTVPSAATRRALLERGDVDLSYDPPPRDASEMAVNPALKVVGTPMESTMQYLGLNVTMKPFDNPKVRQAIAYALPYQKIIDAALFGRARPLFGGPPDVASPAWPQRSPYDTDIARAKKLMADAGFADGIDSVLSFDLSAAVTNEPACALIQESLAQIGVRVTLDKIPGANWRTMFSRKQLAMQTNIFGAWFAWPDYFFWQVYGGQNGPFNTASYVDPAMDRLIDDAHFNTDPLAYRRDCMAMYQKAFDDAPLIPLYQPLLNVAMRRGITGYRYWFHRQIDYRCLEKA